MGEHARSRTIVAFPSGRAGFRLQAERSPYNECDLPLRGNPRFEKLVASVKPED